MKDARMQRSGTTTRSQLKKYTFRLDLTLLLPYDSNRFMGVRRCIVLLLLAGFWLSIHGRLEADFSSSHSSLAFHAADLAHEHEDSSRTPSAPRGDHKDQHGCYHSHAPFVAVTTAFNCQAISTALVAARLEIPYSLALTNILHPPRA